MKFRDGLDAGQWFRIDEVLVCWFRFMPELARNSMSAGFLLPQVVVCGKKQSMLKHMKMRV